MMAPVRGDLPSGTVTFLFTDVEGSTKLLHELGADGYANALAEHRRVIREACAGHDGVEVDTQGDAFFYAFPTAPAALEAAGEMTEALASGPIRVRIGLHTGTPLLTAEGYVGGDVHRAARIAAAGHGGQVLVSSSTAALLDTELVDLGEHRFKDLSAPERVHQLGDGEFPALKSLFRTNLPVPTTPFLGRERELAEVVRLLNVTRLLTLTGPGGTGKTRLAAQAAGLASDGYPDGVWWVPLAPLREPELVLETAAQVIGSQNGLAEHIADKSLLMLFDNFEQVVEAAGDVADLLASCPNLDMLVTSREPLHVTGEQEYSVPPLVHEEGVGFFLARARAIKPDFQADDAVSEICSRLDDLPLALELAAARVKALSSAQILERLDERLPLLTGGARDLPERQRTLHATIEWSYDLLDEDEQRLFARLAVFRGGCALEAAEKVADADLDTLQSLVDKSLLRHTDERFWMLETIRAYAAERLEESGEADELRRRHADHFLALAEESEIDLFGPNPKEWLDRLEAEHNNLRSSIDRLMALGDTQCSLRLVGAIWKFWDLRGHLVEAQRRLEGALAADAGRTVGRAKALAGAARVGRFGSTEAAALRAREALGIYEELGDAWGSAYSQFVLGESVVDDDVERGREVFEGSVRAFRDVGNEHYALLATHNLAATCAELGDDDRARALYEENLRDARLSRDSMVEALALSSLPSYLHDEGSRREALSMLASSTLIFRDLGDRVWAANNLGKLARFLAIEGNARSAAAILSSAEALRNEIGSGEASWVAEMNEQTLATIHAQLDDAAFFEAWEHGRALTIEGAIALALDTEPDA